jgi:hypothetical protein
VDYFNFLDGFVGLSDQRKFGDNRTLGTETQILQHALVELYFIMHGHKNEIQKTMRIQNPDDIPTRELALIPLSNSKEISIVVLC